MATVRRNKSLSQKNVQRRPPRFSSQGATATARTARVFVASVGRSKFAAVLVLLPLHACFFNRCREMKVPEMSSSF
ncbi:hypothetical protein CHX27_09770 [Flavobacterium aurantiibacter]|uniref:Uncharacterized protein n=1 Tax=Flavobacterium aurantiibacter TaxID=2023067 RepID=A0A255ZQ25_9FLAO|nr:hypothetical protein CHX27_09770 [Flavobacterium aurantiibacter]